MKALRFVVVLCCVGLLLLACNRRSPAVSEPSAPKSVPAKVKIERLRVFQEPYLSSDTLMFITPADSVQLVGRTSWTERVDDVLSFWFEVEAKGIKGWSFGGYLEFTGSLTSIPVNDSYPDTGPTDDCGCGLQ